MTEIKETEKRVKHTLRDVTLGLQRFTEYSLTEVTGRTVTFVQTVQITGVTRIFVDSAGPPVFEKRPPYVGSGPNKDQSL